MTTATMTVNMALKKWRKAKGLSLEGFARSIPVSTRTVASWESGRIKKLHFLTLKAIQEKYPDCPLLLPQPPRPTSKRPA